MFTSTTREELEAEIKKHLSPGDLAMVDQMLAAIDEGLRLSGNNSRLMFRADGSETFYGEFVRRVAAGRMLTVDEIFYRDPREVRPTLRLVVIDQQHIDVLLASEDPSRYRGPNPKCFTCGRPNYDTTRASRPEKPLRRLDIGSYVVAEFAFCDECAVILHLNFGPLDWK